MSRWVCLRCYEANDEALAACQKCGLLRGATPAAGEQWAAPTSVGPTRADRGRVLPWLLRFWWVILLVAVPVVGFFINAQRGSEGEITRSGNMAVTELRIGDCFDLQDASADQVQDVIARPCGEGHQYELIMSGSMPAGVYPDDAGFVEWLGLNCVPAFEAYVGISYDRSRYDISWFQPTSDGWSQGDRSVQCAVVDPDQASLTGSLRNAAR